MLTISKAGKKDIKEMCLLLQELFDLEKDFSPDWIRQRRGLELILKKGTGQVFYGGDKGPCPERGLRQNYLAG